MTYIGNGAFYGTPFYNNMDDGVIYLGEKVLYAYKGTMPNNRLIFIKNGTVSISPYAFYNCSGLVSVSIPNSVTSIGGGAFNGCTGLTSVNISDLAAWCNISFSSGDSNPLLYAHHLFLNGTEVTDLVIPNSVTSIRAYAFSVCTGLTSVTIPNNVTSIGEEAFCGCSGLTSITIGNGVTSISTSTFDGCYNLTSVTIPNSVTSIGQCAFRDCSGLSSVTIGNSVTSIGWGAFRGCSGLTEVTCLAENVPQTGTYVFSGVTLSNVTLLVPYKSLSSYKSKSPWQNFGTISPIEVNMNGFYYAFDKSKEEATIVGPVESVSGVLNIPSYVVYEGVDYDVVAIDDKAFENCYDLTSVTIPNSITSIGSEAFYGCTGLTSISISKKVKSIGQSPFKGCSGLTSIVVNSGNTVYDSRNNCNAIIETATGKLIQGCNTTVIPDDIIAIGDYAFYSCRGLSSVTIPNSLTSIGAYAFLNCSGLTSVNISDLAAWCKISFDDFYANPLHYALHLYLNGQEVKDLEIPNNLTAISNYAFYCCRGLTSVTIPNSVTAIGSSAFSYCSGLTSVTIPNSVTAIGSSAFLYCSGLTSVTIGNGVTSIGSCAFYECTSLTSLTLHCASIIDSWFSGIRSIQEVVIGDEVTSISNYAFSGCTGLTSATIGNSVTTIGNYAFSRCSRLTSLTVGESVASIGSDAFYGCSGLTSVTINSDAIVSANRTENNNIQNIFGSQVKEYIIGDNVTAIGEYAFNGCNALTSVTIGESVTTIGQYAFNGCSFDSVIIPNSVTSIGESAFRGNLNLTTVSVGENISSIGDNAFYGCSNMTTFTCYAVDIPTANSSVFEGIDLTGATLYVPASALEDYEDTKPWRRFGTILPIGTIPTAIDTADVEAGDNDKQYYDLSGRRVTSSQRGLRIVRDASGNTRKVLVK